MFPLDEFLSRADVRERHELPVRAPAPLVYEVASTFDLQSVPAVRAIFRMRELVMGSSRRSDTAVARLDVPGLRKLGWGVLAERPGRMLVVGAACRPWQADVVFTPLDASGFAAYDEPDAVRIAWTIEVDPVSTDVSRLATETRAMGTDARARERFRRYWRWARLGIVAIRRLMLPAMRREAEHRWRDTIDRRQQA